jgi:hypothetical protein
MHMDYLNKLCPNLGGKFSAIHIMHTNFQVLPSYILRFCIAWADSRWLGDLAAHINLSSGTSLLIYLEEEINKNRA